MCIRDRHKAMEMIEKAGKGVVVYLNQEGRGIGLMEKMKEMCIRDRCYCSLLFPYLLYYIVYSLLYIYPSLNTDSIHLPL